MDPLDGSFFEDLLDESSWGRFGVADPALPEYLGGTVILLGKMRTWCVKWGMASRAVGVAHIEPAFQGSPSSKVYIIIIMGHL